MSDEGRPRRSALTAGSRWMRQTRSEKRSTISALNLFFGALLGANLGTLERLPLEDYFYMIILLVGAVAAIQMSLASERRTYVLLTLGFYMVVAAAVLLSDSRPESLSPDAALKIFATLAIWIVLALWTELFPTLDGPDRSAGSPSGED